jgi:excisionase family DNA binding protein
MSATEYVPMRSAAERLGVHVNTVRNWIDKGILPAIKLPSGTRRVALEDLERMEASIFGAPSSFREVAFTEAPKPLPESAHMRLERYPHV